MARRSGHTIRFAMSSVLFYPIGHGRIVNPHKLIAYRHLSSDSPLPCAKSVVFIASRAVLHRRWLMENRNYTH